jgi:hypothetical protein
MASAQLTVVFCLPGASYSGRFLQCWTDLLGWCLANGIRPLLSQHYSCNIYYARTMCLGADILRGAKQRPFDGKLAYDYLMWIGSDVVFTPGQFQRLLSHQVDIVAGLYLMEDGKHFATVKDWDEEYFTKHGPFQFLRPEDVQGAQRLVEVAYTGMGFMLVKHGLFEKLEYPWFRPVEKRIGDVVDFTMEDVAFCLRAKETGFTILVDPCVRVGHQKSLVL